MDNAGWPLYHPKAWINWYYHIVIGRRSSLSEADAVIPVDPWLYSLLQPESCIVYGILVDSKNYATYPSWAVVGPLVVSTPGNHAVLRWTAPRVDYNVPLAQPETGLFEPPEQEVIYREL
jgi:hypothetical protein